MRPDETLQHPDQPRVLFSAWLWAVMFFVFFAAIVAITFGAMQRGPTYDADRAKVRAEKLKTAHEEWDKTANSYGWVDKAKRVAHIPIARALELELADLQARKPAPAGPIATPAPAALVAPAAPVAGAASPTAAPAAPAASQPSAAAAPAAAPSPAATTPSPKP